MKKAISLFIIVTILILNAGAQVDRRNTKKSVKYRDNYQRMASGSCSRHSIEIREGTLWAWGYNAYGQLGDGTYNNRMAPVQVGTDTKWINITTGGGHSGGLKSDGTL